MADRRGAAIDLIAHPADLARWLHRAGLDTVETDTVGMRHVEEAVRLREATFRSASALIEHRRPADGDIAVVNALAARPAFRSVWIDDRRVLQAVDGAWSALSFLAADAIDVLTPPRRDRLRACGECGMLFVDRSAPGRRRWCSSSGGCGNRAKVRQFRLRQAERERS